MTMTSIDLRANPKQGRFVGTQAHHAAFVGGIGSGKSFGGSVRALLASQGFIGRREVLQTPNLGMITAPTYPMLKDATLRTFLEIAGDAVVDFNKNEMTATMSNGSEILFRSADNPDRLRGPNISWWFGDEAALYRDDVFTIMIGRLRQFGAQGYEWQATTPRGRNWVWRNWVRDNAENPDWFLVQSTSRENSYLDEAILTSWESVYSGDFAAQELGGEFVAFEGLIYTEFDRSKHVTTYRPDEFQRVIAGVDWGYTNPGVILLFGIDGDGRMWQVEEHYQRQRQIDEWVNVAKQVDEVWRVREWHPDPSEPDFIAKLKAAGLRGVQNADNSVIPGIQAVKGRLIRQGDGKPRLFVHPSCANTIDEFESYQWAPNAKRDASQGFRDEPLKAKDHAMDALRYAVMGANVQRRMLATGANRVL